MDQEPLALRADIYGYDFVSDGSALVNHKSAVPRNCTYSPRTSGGAIFASSSGTFSAWTAAVSKDVNLSAQGLNIRSYFNNVKVSFDVLLMGLDNGGAKMRGV